MGPLLLLLLQLLLQTQMQLFMRVPLELLAFPLLLLPRPLLQQLLLLPRLLLLLPLLLLRPSMSVCVPKPAKHGASHIEHPHVQVRPQVYT